jgi:hypothetical protein
MAVKNRCFLTSAATRHGSSAACRNTDRAQSARGPMRCRISERAGQGVFSRGSFPRMHLAARSAWLQSFVLCLTLAQSALLAAEAPVPTAQNFRIKRNGDAILLPVDAGVGQHLFVFDTGASISAFDVSLRPLLGAEIRRENARYTQWECGYVFLCATPYGARSAVPSNHS